MNLNSLPNAVSFLRIILVALYIWLLYTTNQHTAVIALAVIIIISDAIDGFLARRLHCESRLGSWLDSIADASFILLSWLVFYLKGSIGVMLFILLISPKILTGLFIITLRIIRRKWELQHLAGDKFGAVASFFAILWILLGLPYIMQILWMTAAISLSAIAWSAIERSRL